MNDLYSTHAAFLGDRLLAQGSLAEVLAVVKASPSSPPAPLLIFQEKDGQQVDFDLRASVEDIVRRHESPAVRGVGRPKLGVSSREVTLLPRHWAWLETRRGGASAALRRLVDAAMLTEESGTSASAIDALYRILSALAGNQPGFEEASRALYRGDREGFLRLVQNLSGDLSAYFTGRIEAAG